MQVERVLPTAGVTTAAEAVSGLALGEHAPTQRPYIALNMVATLDGKAALGGTTRGLGGETDRELFLNLRTQVDAVMVGAGTVRAERYGRIVRDPELRAKREAEGLKADPLAVIVSASLNLPADLPLLQDPDSHVVVATASEVELQDTNARIDYLRTGDDLPLMLARLREEHGVRSVLCEGGPILNSHLFAADLVDELFLTIDSRVAGGAAALTIVAGRPLPEPSGMSLVWLLKSGDDLFGRWRVNRAG